MINNLKRNIRRVIATGCIFTMAATVFTGCSAAANKQEASTPAPKVTEEVAAYQDSSKSIDERVEDLLGRMTLEQKIAQMIMAEKSVEAGGASTGDVKRYGLGAVLSGGGSAPSTGNNPEDWSELINSYKQAALDSELGIPLLYGVDAVHGNNNVYGTTVFPHQIGLGAAGDAELVEKIGSITAMETRAIGANYAFSPVLGMAYNESWGRFYECFGEKSDIVEKLGVAYVNGYQGVLGGEDFLSKSKVVCSIKHFIGEGQTAYGKNQGNVSMTDEEWENILDNELIVPYKAAIEAGAQTVMVSYNSINGVNCHENRQLITDLLKGELGFSGFVISDYDGVEHCAGPEYKNQLAYCVNAGVDMLMEPLDWQNCYYTLIQLVNEGVVSEDRINDAVTRILKVKFNAGLFEEEINGAEEKQFFSEIGSDEHRGVARQAVRESVTLLKNGEVNGKTAIEALAESKNIAVLGRKSDDIGVQCGGWTISWNGTEGDITEGTTLLEGFKQVAVDKTFEYSPDDSAITDETDGVIIVVGESPYSESKGDTGVNGLMIKPAEINLIQKASEAVGDDVPVVVILLTGRPLTLYDELQYMDGLVCAWLPGTEGAGVADVLFGEYDFTGKTTVTWPKYGEDIESKLTDEGVVLFKNGTGLKKKEIG